MPVSPVNQYISHIVPATAAGADALIPFMVAPDDGVIEDVEYVPTATITGANTNSRTLTLVNTGQAGAGTTVAASKAFVSGTNAPVNQQTPITLSATPANLVVAAGDVLAFNSLHVGTGLADPGGLLRVAFNINYA